MDNRDRLLRDLGGVRAVLFEDTCRGELSQLVAYHIFGNEDRIENLPIVDEEGVAHELGSDCRTTRPSFDRTLDSGVVKLVDLFKEMHLNERTFFK